MSGPGVLVSAYILDLIIGDPSRFPHPVRGIGWCIEKAEHVLRKKIVNSEHRVKASRERLAGFFLASFIAGSTFVLFSVVSKTLLHSRFQIFFSYV
jgi:adenosylcobinamide-phosphate synthase